MTERRIHIQPLGHPRLELPEARCMLSGKLSFPSQEAAERQATEWAHHNSMEGYVYECECGAWHITRRPR